MNTSGGMRGIVWFALVLITVSCSRKQEIAERVATVFTQRNAVAPYFTSDATGKPVLCWTATDDSVLYYAVYDRFSGSFGTPLAVPPSKGTTGHGESMNKVAFLGDGTVIAVFEMKHPTENNKYAGSILYAQSFDNGANWTKAKFVHSDTLKDNSRSFFDVVMLPDGEVGAVWLDGRLRLGSEGSSLYFARTKGHEGFQRDQPIGHTVCQCCRTDISTDPRGNVHIIYRDIEATAEGSVRDFMHIISTDSGKTFSAPRAVSNDNWIVDGCPHTGASMAAGDERIEVVWFTAGGRPGLYYASSSNGADFAPRRIISETARHPQMASMGSTSVIVVEESRAPMSVAASHGDHGMNSGTPIVAIWHSADGTLVRTVIDDSGEYPVVTFADYQTVLIAYTAGYNVVVRRAMVVDALNQVIRCGRFR